MTDLKRKMSICWVACCLTTFLSFTTAANAAIFHCVDAKGNSNFQDKPCQIGDTREIVSLPKSSSLKSSSSLNGKAEMKILKQQRTKNNKRNKVLETLARKENRLKTKSYQRDLKLKEKAEKKLARCQKIQEKIDWIESQLRHGSKFKSHYRLNEELNRYQKMKSRSCQAS